MIWFQRNWHRVLVHAASVALLAWLAFDFIADAQSYTVNRTLMLRSGTVGLILLVASFACTPLARLLPWPQATQMRRALGLYGFTFVAIHLLVYAYAENDFNLELILRDLEERRAMSVGLIAFVAFVPLAITSTKGWQRRLGRRWAVLHRLIYLALPLSVVHYLLLDRDFITVPLVFAAIVAVLFLARVGAVRRPAAMR